LAGAFFAVGLGADFTVTLTAGFAALADTGFALALEEGLAGAFTARATDLAFAAGFFTLAWSLDLLGCAFTTCLLAGLFTNRQRL
jgi:hypothetical protein